jgi:nitrite reductase/ring-hydroxylating ferredoxin subunit
MLSKALSLPALRFLRPRRTPAFSPTFAQARPFSRTAFTMGSEFKLKGQSNLELKEGEKIECEVEGIEGGKVVLVRVPGQKEIRALNANCTHFGAPLKNGVLTPDGRLTCPWHGGEEDIRKILCKC